MSPTLLTKYLDAAKDVAEHAVLLPGGIAFSDATTQRNRAEEKLAAIRNFYSQFAESGGATSLSLQGVKIASDDAGVIPLEKYLVVTLEEREAISSGVATLDEVANRHGLNAKYLRSLWESLTDTASSLPLDLIRRQWRAATPVDALSLPKRQGVGSAVWTFTTVGHIGKRDGPQAWQIPVSPLASFSELQVKLPEMIRMI